MSRHQQPFPLSQRRPSVTDYAAPTRPLQISRNPRPTTPSNASVSSIGGSPGAPSRPERSHRRGQPSEVSISDVQSAFRPPRDSRERMDSTGTSRSDASLHYSSRNDGASTISPPPRTRRPVRQDTAGSQDSDSPAVAFAMSAFSSAAKKATLDSYGDGDYERERRRAQEEEERRQLRIRERAPGRRVNGRPRAGDIDAVLDEIKDEWEAVTDPNFNPVDLALQILGDSSSSRDMTSFRRTKRILSQALKGSVDKHYQAFAAALPHHASLITHLSATQGQVKDARTALQEAKDALGNKRSDLVQLWSRTRTLEEMLRILDQIEQLRLVPDVLESLMSEKRLLQASILLVNSLKTINNQDMLDIGAVADLRTYLVGQEAALRDILIDEIHSHLYLKSFWCESRWAPYTPNQQTLPKVDFERQHLSSEPRIPLTLDTSTTNAAETTRLSRYLTELTLRPNDPPTSVDESSFRGPAPHNSIVPSSSGHNLVASTSTTSLAIPTVSVPGASDDNPESDSFRYLETLLESLAVLGKLGNGLDIITQRLPNEIYALIETTVDEVGERMEYNRRTSNLFLAGANPGKTHSIYVFAAPLGTGIVSSVPAGAPVVSKAHKNHFMDSSRLRLTALESSSRQSDYEILRDLFWTVYSKLYAVLQGLRVVYEVSNRIGTRRDFKDSSGAKPGSLFPLSDIWLPIQAEVRTLLYDYVTDEEQGAISGRNPISSINDILREGRFSRDKSKHVFRFADTDAKLSSKILRPHEEELNRVLRETVPGLVQGSVETSVQATLSSVGTDERLLGIEQHHRLLIKPDAFHVSVLFQPMLSFLERVTAILPSGFESARASSAVMEEFVLDVYLPQLESKVSQLFHQAVSSTEAFQPDPSSSWLSKEPLVNASTQLMSLVNSLCTMLVTSPFHRENYARLILTVIIQFYQRCSDRFQEIVTSDETQLLGGDNRVALAAQWAQHSELTLCLSQLFDTPSDADAKRLELWRQEREIEVGLLRGGMIEKEGLVHPLRNLASLGHLYRSVIWFAAALRKLKAVSDDLTSPTSPPLTGNLSALTLQVPFLPPSQSDSREGLQLPLSHEMTMRFHALLKTYEQLAEMILYTMRIDVRCRIIRYLELASRHGNYNPDREVGEPDPHVIDLNMALSECEDAVAMTVPTAEQRFIFDGTGFLIEELLISTASNVRKINANGAKKISRNILALQQCVKTITQGSRDAEFERAKQYWALFSRNPADMLDDIRQKQVFTFDQYKVMLDLQCGVDPVLGEKSAAQATDRNYSMYVIDLHGMELEDTQ